MGAWIEIFPSLYRPADIARRPRMGAWIEIWGVWCMDKAFIVAPVWGRGLKLARTNGHIFLLTSPPYGGVD